MSRPRKDGGYSFSQDEMVGKGRCCHILGDNENPAMEIVRGMYEVQIENSKVTINAQKEAIVDSLSKLDDENHRLFQRGGLKHEMERTNKVAINRIR